MPEKEAPMYGGYDGARGRTDNIRRKGVQMTRCYEYYCMYENTPDKCELSERSDQFVRKYMKKLKSRDIKFDKSPKDKIKFYNVTAEVGSESTKRNTNLSSGKTKLQAIKELGLTEDEVQSKIGFHWDTLSVQEITRAFSNKPIEHTEETTKDEEITEKEEAIIKDEAIKQIYNTEKTSVSTCPNCGWEIKQ